MIYRAVIKTSQGPSVFRAPQKKKILLGQRQIKCILAVFLTTDIFAVCTPLLFILISSKPCPPQNQSDQTWFTKKSLVFHGSYVTQKIAKFLLCHEQSGQSCRQWQWCLTRYERRRVVFGLFGQKETKVSEIQPTPASHAYSRVRNKRTHNFYQFFQGLWSYYGLKKT